MILYKQNFLDPESLEMDLTPTDIKKDIEKTRLALDAAYAGFNNATDFDMIDSYIFEINALQQRYRHLTALIKSEEPPQDESGQKAPVRSWIARILR